MTTPLQRDLAARIQKHRKQIFEWYFEHAKINPPPFYCSIDLRDSGHKIAPVDSNLYPAGFNNICPEDTRTASPIMRAQLEAAAAARGLPAPNRILILPESHTQNLNYIENLYYLKHILHEAGFETRIGWYATASGRVELRSASGKELHADPIQISDDGQLSAGGFLPHMIVINNDFSSGYPEPLDRVQQPTLPSHKLGWHTRKKSDHFKHYNELAAEFARIIDIDPWIIQVETEAVGPVNFNLEEGTEEVAHAAERMLAKIQASYDAHSVRQKPFVFVKNNSGTYGIGIMVVHSAEELRQMNRRTKNKMSVGKNRLPIESVVVQEGIPTATLVDRLAAEPVIYLVGCELIGGFLRTNTERGVEDNLNSQGMVFKKLCMSDLRHEDEASAEPEPVLELVYGSIARISALAAGRELSGHLKRSQP